MNGLLNFLRTPEGVGLLGAVGGYASSAQRGAPINSIGRGLLAGTLAYGQGLDRQERISENAQQKQVRDIQMQAGLLGLDKTRRDMAQEQAIQDAAKQSMVSPEQANAMSMGPMQDGSFLPQVQPGFNQASFLQSLKGIAPLKAMDLEQTMRKANAPVTVAAGASLVDPTTNRPVFTAPKVEETPSAVREYQFAKQQGFGGTFEQWQTSQKKAGANNVSLSVNSEKSLLNDVAGGLGKSLVESRSGAQAALGTIGTVNRLFDALDSGKVMAGPGTTFRQYGLQVGNLLGVSGKDANEKLLNTRQAIQSLAQLELDAAQQMKGQGQITEAERSIIRRAASGDIDGMTASELRLLGGVLDRSARTKIQGYNTQVKPLLSNPNAAPIAPFLSVEEPAGRSASGAVRRFNPATGRIE